MKFFNSQFPFQLLMSLVVLGACTIECRTALADSNAPQAGAEMIDMETGTCYSGTPQGIRVETHGKIDTLICEDGAVFQVDRSRGTVTFKCIRPELAMKH